jgi:hypothetical protein
MSFAQCFPQAWIALPRLAARFTPDAAGDLDCCQPADGCLRHAIGSGEIGLHSALRKPLDDLPPLMWGELSLELGQATKDVSICCRGA